MGDAVLRLRVHRGKGLLVSIRLEQRVVAKARVPARRLGDGAGAGAVYASGGAGGVRQGNHGAETGGRTVALYIDGYLEQSQTVGISPGSCKNVVFRVTKATPGTYAVSLEGQHGWFTVAGEATTAMTCFPGGLGAGGIAVIAIFIVALVLAIVFVFSRSDAK